MVLFLLSKFWLAPQVVNIPNSMTVLPELLPMSVEMSRRKLTGIMNFTNPGVVSHNEILQARLALQHIGGHCLSMPCQGKASAAAQGQPLPMTPCSITMP